MGKGALCTKTKDGAHWTRCLTVNNTKPGKAGGGGGGGGGGGHHPKPPPDPEATAAVLIWVGELADGGHVALLVNNREQPATLRFDAAELGSAVSNPTRDSDRGGGCYEARELWSNKTLPQPVCAGSVLQFPAVGAHDCVLLRFSPSPTVGSE